MAVGFRSRMWLGAVILVIGCRQEGAPTRFETIEGGPCSAQSPQHCHGPDSMLMCVDREWTEVACEEFCALHGLRPSTEGCVVGEWYDWCPCTNTYKTCADIVSTCVSVDSIEVCMDGELSVFDCADVCADLDPPRNSLGCDNAGWIADCTCTLEATSCADTDPTRCDGPVTLASCVDGAWVIEACEVGCGPDQLGYCSTSLADGELTAQCSCS
jgi:hypothetical protein